MNELDRIKDLNAGLPGPRPEARSDARAALVARFEALEAATSKPAPRRLLRTRNLAIGAASALAAVALLIGLGSSGGSSVHPEIASAAELNELAELAPHLEIAGGWQITHTEASPEGGATVFHYERDGPEAPPTEDAEIQWHSASVEELGEQLEGEGFEAAGTQPTATISEPEMRAGNWDTMYTNATAQVYAGDPAADGLLEAAGVWQQDGWTFVMRSRVEDLEKLERLLERPQLLSREEWLVAIRPGGGEWLRTSMSGTVKRVETAETKLPDGSVGTTTWFIARSSKELREDPFTAPFPVIYRDGDKVRVEVEEVPDPVAEAP